MSKKLLLSASVAVLLFGASACGDDSGDGNGEGSGGEETSSSEGNAAPEPDVEDVPDVVAEVNGEEIPKDEFVQTYEGQFQQMAMQSQQTGEEVDQEQLKKDTAEGLVDNEILLQEAGNRGLEASDKEVQQTLKDLAQQNGMGSPDEFLSAMEQQGMNKDAVMPQVEMQVQVEKLITDEAGDIEPTEEELKKLYDETKAQQEQMGGGQGGGGQGGGGQGGGQQQIPPFEEVKPQLVEQAKSEKQSEVAQGLVDQLREDADISINL